MENYYKRIYKKFKVEFNLFLNSKNFNFNLLNNLQINYYNNIYNLNELSNIKIFNNNIVYIIPYDINTIDHILIKLNKYKIYFNIINKKKHLILIKKYINTDLPKISLKLQKICNLYFIKLKLLREKLIKNLKNKFFFNKDNLFINIKNINNLYLFYKNKINDLFLNFKKKNK
ncbi:MAG: ribosome recycling factor [Candidatus Shikimatogenerans sp. AspAUS03]|uniref:Ribosome recycling factor n=1 Tax=Candidatus Shikimatogenerans sp. AspAUS03 TaxID=3158563 RepID=A0AAU7QSW9_9FLAO